VKKPKTYSADSYERKKSAERAKNKGLKKDIIDIQEKAIYESHENKLVYTYVLKDIQKNIYKIGKTADPHARFKSLCVRGKVLPIALVNKDVEDILHAKYADNRIVNEDYKLNGATEWFRPGGKFDEFIASVDKGVFLPYVTLHSLVQDLLENKNIRLNDPTTEWELSQNKFGYYFVGLEVLVMLGYVQRTKSVILPGNKEDVLLIGSKLSVSERAVDDIKNNYIIYLSTTLGSSIIKENKNKDSRLRKVDLKSKEFSSEVFLLLNKVL
jgi:hypothetical protein